MEFEITENIKRHYVLGATKKVVRFAFFPVRITFGKGKYVWLEKYYLTKQLSTAPLGYTWRNIKYEKYNK